MRKPTVATQQSPPTIDERIAAVVLSRWPEKVTIRQINGQLFKFAVSTGNLDRHGVIEKAIKANTPLVCRDCGRSKITASTAIVGDLFARLIEIAIKIDPDNRKASYLDVHTALMSERGDIFRYFRIMEFLVDANLEFRLSSKANLVTRCEVETVAGVASQGFCVTQHGVNFLLEMRGRKCPQ